jgi:hypothetical protein
VTGRDAAGRPLTDNAASDKPQPFAYTQADGSYVLWDMFPSQGNLSLTAVPETLTGGGPIPACPPESLDVQCETAFQHVIEKCGSQTTYYANQASANFTFPAAAVQSGPIPPVTIRVMRLTNGQRAPSGGVAVEGEPLVIGFLASDASVQTIEIEHNGIREPGPAVRRDTAVGQPLPVDYVADFTPTSAGTYTIVATALPLPSGAAFTVSSTFRVVAAGGDTTSPVPDSPPGIVTDRTVPSNGSDGVPTAVTPQVVFTEPVLGVADQVTLREAEPPNALVDVTLTGITRSGTPVDLEPSNPAAVAITSLTVQPKRQLNYGTQYELILGTGIFDLDNTLAGGPGAGRTLQRTTTTFKTVVAQALTDPGAGFGSPGVATAGDYAYLFESAFTYGLLHVFDVSNPADPVEFPDAQKRALGRPMGIAAEADANGGGATVVVATGPANTSLPSNIRIYQATTVTNTTPTGQISTSVTTEWVGAATLAATAAEGIVQRVALKGNFAYAVSTFKGLQVVDIQVAKNVFANLGGDVSEVRVPLNTDGMGVGQEAVVATIPILKGSRPAFLYDVKVADLNDGFLQPIAVVAGDVGIVLVNPQTAEVLPGRPLEARGFRARAVDVGRVKGRDIAVVVGEQGGQSGLVVIDITEPRSPVIKGEMVLLNRPVGLKLKNDLALVGTDSTMPRVEIINIEDIALPIGAGHIDHVAGNVAVAANGAVVTNMPAKTDDLQAYLGGVRTATLGLLPTIGHIPSILAREIVIGAVKRTRLLDPINVPVTVFGGDRSLDRATVVLEAHSTTATVGVQTPSLSPDASGTPKGETTFTGVEIDSGHTLTVTVSVESNGRIVKSTGRTIKLNGECDADTDDDRVADCIDGFDRTWPATVPIFVGLTDNITSRNFTTSSLPTGDKVTAGLIFDGLTSATRTETSRGSIVKLTPSNAGTPTALNADSIVIHDCEGWFNGCVTELLPTQAIHFVIGRSGRLVQIAPLDRRGIHATYYNSRGIGIELEGCNIKTGPNANCDFPVAMQRTVGNLVALLWPTLKGPTLPAQPTFLDNGTRATVRSEVAPVQYVDHTVDTGDCWCRNQKPPPRCPPPNTTYPVYRHLEKPGVVLRHSQIQPDHGCYDNSNPYSANVKKIDPEVTDAWWAEFATIARERHANLVRQPIVSVGIQFEIEVSTGALTNWITLKAEGGALDGTAETIPFCEDAIVLPLNVGSNGVRFDRGAISLQQGQFVKVRCPNGLPATEKKPL